MCFAFIKASRFRLLNNTSHVAHTATLSLRTRNLSGFLNGSLFRKNPLILSAIQEHYTFNSEQRNEGRVRTPYQMKGSREFYGMQEVSYKSLLGSPLVLK